MFASHVRKGNLILYKDEPHRVLEFAHRTPGNLRAFVQMKLRSLKSGSAYEVRFSATENVERVILDQKEMEYLYSDTLHHFMDTQTFEQIVLDDEALGSALNYLMPGVQIMVDFFESQPIGVELPSSVELTVVETEPELKGATVSSSYKPAKLETGVTIQVPPFIKEGDRIRVNPQEDKYMERVR